MHKTKRTRAYRFSGGNPAFPAQWFYGFLRALLGDRALLPPSPPRSLLLENLTPASGRRDHTTSPSALARSSCAPLRPPHPAPYVRDDREPPLLWARDGRACRDDLPDDGSGIFFVDRLDRFLLICLSGSPEYTPAAPPAPARRGDGRPPRRSGSGGCTLAGAQVAPGAERGGHAAKTQKFQARE